MARSKELWEWCQLVRTIPPNLCHDSHQGRVISRMGRGHLELSRIFKSSSRDCRHSTQICPREYQYQRDFRLLDSVASVDRRPDRVPSKENSQHRRRQRNHVSLSKISQARDARMHGFVRLIYCLQLETKFIIKLCGVPSNDSADVEALTRPESTERVRLCTALFNRH